LSRRKPRNAPDGEAEGHRDGVKHDPSGLRVKSTRRDLLGTGMPNQDQRGDTHRIQ
jgi:hypothetical protein